VTPRKLGPQIFDVNVGAEANVVSEVPAVVVGVFVDDDIVATPIPVAAKTEVERRDAEVEAAEPEAAGTASGKMPHVAAAETAGEVAVRPGMIEVVINASALFVSDPCAVVVNVRSFGMALDVFRRPGWSAMRRRRTVFGNESTTDSVTAVLSPQGNGENQR